MFNTLLIVAGKAVSKIIKVFNIGACSTWPGHIALNLNKNFIKNIIKQNPHLKVIVIAGTNGKTTTGKLVKTILEKAGKRVFQNEAGANLLNGIASSTLLHSSILLEINYDYAIFEVDENTLPLALKEFTPNYLIILNLFRDQLDRYGEVNTIAAKWQKALIELTEKTSLILNADDPQIAYLGHLYKNNYRSKPRTHDLTVGALGNFANAFYQMNPRSYERGIVVRGKNSMTFYFGLNDKKFAQVGHQHAVDSTYCPNCGSKLEYHKIYYSHLGDWECKNCNYKRPKKIYSSLLQSKLRGTYNLYNVLSASLTAKKIGISGEIINRSLKTFVPAFGRQEILSLKGKKAQIFLSKNPTSFNESLRTISNLDAKNVLFILNDRIPDGRDVSWIWDVDFEDYIDTFKTIFVSGDRCYDMTLRIKYAFQNSEFRIQNFNSKFKIYEKLEDSVKKALDTLPKKQTLYILPTYSAMLEVRKILAGKKIL